MSMLACRYAIIRFMPYPETEEFANVGIVLVCPRSGYFDFLIETKKYSRITNFFDDLDGRMYRSAVGHFREELLRVKGVLQQAPTAEGLRAAFEHLTRPREAIVRFSPERTALAEHPQQLLTQLFDHYVSRNFATHEYKETLLERKVAKMVQELQLEAPFKAARIGDDEFNVNFNLVQQREEVATKIIKPLFLGHDEPNKIYNHGDAWIAKVKRLKRVIDCAPALLFAVKKPDTLASDKQSRAAQSVIAELRDQNILIVDERDTASILTFATT